MLALALLAPALAASPACAHAAKQGAKRCCCSHDTGSDPGVARPMDCCRVERPAVPLPAQGTPSDTEGSAAPASMAAEESACGDALDRGEPAPHDRHVRSDSPPGPLFLLNSVFRI